MSQAGDGEGKAEGKSGSPGGGPDALSLDALYRKYGPSLYWVCLKYTRNREDAEDMVGQVFLKAQAHLARFLQRSGVYTWLYRIAVNECLQMLRKRKWECDLPEDAWNQHLASDRTKETEERMVLAQIGRLTDPRTMEILFLLYLEGLTQEEVAEVLDISRITINRKVRVFKDKLSKLRDKAWE